MKHSYLTGVAFALAFWLGCNPYKDAGLKGDFNAGSADPANFPSPYRGTGASRNVAGSGRFTEVRAYIEENPSAYFLFPYPPAQQVTPGYTYSASALNGDAGYVATQTSKALDIRNLTLPLAYVFDPPGGGTPFPQRQACVSPSGYSYDRRRDDVRYDEQGNIFTELPAATFTSGLLPTWLYVPVIREVPVRSNGESCQQIKSERTLLARGDVIVPKASPDATSGTPDGKYLALAQIDPGSGVYRFGQSPAPSPTLDNTGTDIQHWGWYQQFLIAYIEGGYVPVDLANANRFLAQNLYIPSRIAGTPPSVGKVGAGYDVLEFPRGHPNYSPICRVLVYDTGPAGLPLAALPRNASAAASRIPPPAPPAAPPANSIVSSDTNPMFVFCLQSP